MTTDNYEMDIQGFKNYLISSLNFLRSLCTYMFKVLRKKILFVSLFIAASVAIAFFVLQGKKKETELRMSCVYYDNNQRVFGELLQQIDILLQTKSYDEVAFLLKMKSEDVVKMISLNGKTLALGKLEEDYSQNKTSFYIYTKVSDISVLPVLEEKVVAYLNDNPLSVKSLERQKNKWQSRISFYEQQLSKLDSLKEVIRISYLNGSNNIDLAQQNNSVVDIYRLSDSMSFFLADIEYYAKHYTTIEKVYGFMPTKAGVSGSLAVKLFLIAIGAFSFIWIVLALLSLSRNAPQIRQHNEN